MATAATPAPYDSSGTMSALVFCGDGASGGQQRQTTTRPVAFSASVPRPRLQRPLDVIVRVTCAGVCGSDLHCAWHCLEKGLAAGCVVGHEAVGTVVALGEAAAAEAWSGAGGADRPLRVGDRVLVPFTASCGACVACARGDTCRCASSRLFGWRTEKKEGAEAAAAAAAATAAATPDEEGELDGCQAQFVRVPLAPSTLLRLPAGAPDELGLLLGDILSTAFFCARQGGVSPATRSVAVVGCGPVGLLAVLAAKHESKGRARVVAVDGVAERRAMALELMGADAVSSPDLGEAMAALRGPGDGDGAGGGGGESGGAHGADVVLELVGGDSGRPDGPLRLAFDLLRPAGVLASQGVHTGAAWPWTPVEAYDKNLTLKCGRCPARRVAGELLRELFSGGGGDGDGEAPADVQAAAASLLIERALRVFTHRLPMREGPAGYEMFAARRAVKVALDPWA